MTDFTPLLQPDKGQAARTIEIVSPSAFEDWYKALSPRARAAVDAAGFKGKSGEQVRLGSETPEDWSYAVGTPDPHSVWDLCATCAALPAGTYRLASSDPGLTALGWLLTHYRFDRYKAPTDPVVQRILLTPNPAAIPELVRLAEATALVRDLVSTPAADMGPAELEAEATRIAHAHDGACLVTKGDALETGYPLIHAVGKAAERSRAPRLIEIEWGNPAHPRLAIIGKGVCFDSGGLDIKTSGGMRIMKKDMGGAAHALALAQLVMQHRLPVRLHMLVPAVENAIAGNAFRPGDIIKSRQGLTVEIDNTDAEGRLVLADALTKAGEEKAELMLDFATLTGAARTALGPDLPALFSNDHDLARAYNEASVKVHDAVWRLPLWTRYFEYLKSDFADIANGGGGGMAGAITAALFLKKFVPDGTLWAHLDTFSWRSGSVAGRPAGGEALGLRAAWEVLKERYPIV